MLYLELMLELTVQSSRLFVLTFPRHQVRIKALPCSYLSPAISSNTDDMELTATSRQRINANGMLSAFAGLG